MSEIIPVSAGPVTAWFQPIDGMLRRLSLGGTEICRGIYGAVRDANWDTVTPRLEDLMVNRQDHRFAITFTAVCHAREIRYRWHGRITGDEEGAIRYTFHGEAEAPFRRNRIGLCVLHPIRECAGLGCRVGHGDGSETTGCFPARISPHQPFDDISSLSHDAADGVEVTVRFEGEVFEMEDQRNWTDASFKTYGTPLSLPFPVQVAAGADVKQSVRVVPRGAAYIGEPAGDKTHSLVVDWERLRPWTPVGVQASPAGRVLQAREAESLAALELHHLRIDVDFRGSWRSRLHDGLEECRRLKASPLLAFTVSDAAADELEAARAVLDEERLSPAGVIVFHRYEKVTGERWLACGDRIFDDPVIGGTNAYFAELNRQRPGPECAAKRMHVFSMNPQVHAFNDLSLMETLEAQPETLRSALLFCRQPLLISPITLLPRFNPNATEDPMALLPQNDPRQRSAFGAAWTLGSLAALQGRRPAPHALTFHQTTGGAGVLDGDEIYPVYEVLAAVAGATGVAECRVSAPGRLAALAVVRGEERRLHLGNLTDAPMDVAWRDSEFGKIHLDPYGWENLAR